MPTTFNEQTRKFDTEIVSDLAGGAAYYTALTYAKLLGPEKVGIVSAVGEDYENS